MCGNFGLCEDDCTLEKSWMTNGIVKKIPLMLMIVEGEFWSNRVSNKEIGEYRETIWGEEGECGQIASLYLEWRRRWIRSMRRSWRTSHQHLEWRYKSSEGLGGSIGSVLGGNSWVNSLTVWVLLTRSTLWRGRDLVATHKASSSDVAGID